VFKFDRITLKCFHSSCKYFVDFIFDEEHKVLQKFTPELSIHKCICRVSSDEEFYILESLDNKSWFNGNDLKKIDDIL